MNRIGTFVYGESSVKAYLIIVYYYLLAKVWNTKGEIRTPPVAGTRI